MQKKTAISLISYDSHYLAGSIEKYYPYVDEIVLGLDKDRISWSNNPFSFDEAKLWSELSAIDGDSKITVIEENFHKSAVAIENDNYERNLLKGQASNEWVISIDADEYLVNAREFFIDFCPLVEKYNKKVDICMTWATPYKTIDDTTLIIANNDGTVFLGENQGILTHKNNTFTYARWTDLSAAGNNRVMSPLVAIHWSLCRNQADLYEKINNIGHSDIVEQDPFYAVWSDTTLENYHTMKNFKTSGLGQAQWPSLVAVPSKNVENYVKETMRGFY